MKLKNYLVTICSILLILSLLSGCGASSSAMTEAADMVVSVPSVESSKGSYDTNYGYSVESPAEAPASEDSGSGLSHQSLTNTKLIYTANIELETTEFDSSIAGLEDLVDSMGGYFESSYVNNYGSYRHGGYTVRVPAEHFDAFCTAVGEICQLNSISRAAEDVSEAYYDTESRLITQQTKLERLQILLAQAVSMEDIITLESAISETELNIERLTGTLRKYDSLVGYSTITISIDEVYKLTEVEQPVIGFGAKLAQAFETGCGNFVDSLQRTLLRMARNWVDWLIFFIIVAVVIVIVVRKMRKRIAKYAPVVRKDVGEKKE